jgi:hypothetical protein
MKRNYNHITVRRGCFDLLSPQDESISINFRLREKDAVGYQTLSIDSDYADESDFSDLSPLEAIAELRQLWNHHYFFTSQTRTADALEAYLLKWQADDEIDRIDYELAQLSQQLHDTIAAIREKRAYRREFATAGQTALEQET